MSYFQSRFFYFSQLLAVLAAFAIVFPVGLGNVIMALLLITFLLSGQFKELWSVVTGNRAVQVGLGLFFILLVGITYSPSSFSVSFLVLNKYRSLILLPILVVIFQDTELRKNAVIGFLLAMVIAIAISWFMRLGWVSIGNAGEEFIPFKGRISYGVFVAFSIYLSLNLALVAPSRVKQLVLLIYILVAIHNLLFMCSGRMGGLLLLALIALASYQKYKILITSIRMALLTAGAITLLIILMLNSAAITDRKEDIQLAKSNPEESSMGIRLIFWKTSLRIISDSPLIGSGTGSFEIEYFNHRDSNSTLTSNNPHNEFLFITSQTGLLGFAALVGLLLSIWFCRDIDSDGKLIAQGIVLTMLFTCLFNSYLRDEGYFFVIFASLALASKNNKLIKIK